MCVCGRQAGRQEGGGGGIHHESQRTGCYYAKKSEMELVFFFPMCSCHLESMCARACVCVRGSEIKLLDVFVFVCVCVD